TPPAGKKLPSGDGKSPGSTNAHSGKAPDPSGPTLAPLETSFLRRKVASCSMNERSCDHSIIPEFCLLDHALGAGIMQKQLVDLHKIQGCLPVTLGCTGNQR